MAFTPTDPTKAEVRVTGTAPNQQLDFYIPRGAKGDPGGWNTGTDLSTTTNLNDIKVPGLYRNWTNTAATVLNNYPTGVVNATCTLEVIVAANPTGDVIQRITPMSGNSNILRVMYIRRCLAGVWSDWRTFSTTRVDQTAGRVIYQWDDVNQREQLVYGDTGIRDIHLDQAWNDALFNGTSVVKNNSNLVRLRRVDSVVDLFWAFDRNISGTITMPAAFPIGFRPVNPFMYLGCNSGMVLARVYHGGGSSGLVYNNQTAVASAASLHVSYTTTDTWPTTLPGTAVGTIPNL